MRKVRTVDTTLQGAPSGLGRLFSMFSFRRVLVPVLSCLSCLSCLSLLLSLSLPCPALSGLCFPLQLRRCKYRAVPVPLAPFALVCHRYLPCPASFGRSPLRREQGSRGSWYLAASPPVQCVYPPLSGRALFFFFRYLHQGLPAWAPLQLGSPSYHNRRHTPLPFLHSPPRLACLPSHRVLLPCVHVHAICWMAQSRTTARA